MITTCLRRVESLSQLNAWVDTCTWCTQGHQGGAVSGARALPEGLPPLPAGLPPLSAGLPPPLPDLPADADGSGMSEEPGLLIFTPEGGMISNGGRQLNDR